METKEKSKSKALTDEQIKSLQWVKKDLESIKDIIMALDGEKEFPVMNSNHKQV